MYPIFTIHSSIRRHAGCLRSVAVVGNAAVNVGVWRSLPDTDFVPYF